MEITDDKGRRNNARGLYDDLGSRRDLALLLVICAHTEKRNSGVRHYTNA